MIRRFNGVASAKSDEKVVVGARSLSGHIVWMRQTWAKMLSEATDADYDWRSYNDQGLALTPVKPLSRRLVELDRRRGGSLMKERAAFKAQRDEEFLRKVVSNRSHIAEGKDASLLPTRLPTTERPSISFDANAFGEEATSSLAFVKKPGSDETITFAPLPSGLKPKRGKNGADDMRLAIEFAATLINSGWRSKAGEIALSSFVKCERAVFARESTARALKLKIQGRSPTDLRKELIMKAPPNLRELFRTLEDDAIEVKRERDRAKNAKPVILDAPQDVATSEVTAAILSQPPSPASSGTDHAEKFETAHSGDKGGTIPTDMAASSSSNFRRDFPTPVDQRGLPGMPQISQIDLDRSKKAKAAGSKEKRVASHDNIRSYSQGKQHGTKFHFHENIPQGTTGLALGVGFAMLPFQLAIRLISGPHYRKVRSLLSRSYAMPASSAPVISKHGTVKGCPDFMAHQRRFPTDTASLFKTDNEREAKDASTRQTTEGAGRDVALSASHPTSAIADKRLAQIGRLVDAEENDQPLGVSISSIQTTPATQTMLGSEPKTSVTPTWQRSHSITGGEAPKKAPHPNEAEVRKAYRSLETLDKADVVFAAAHAWRMLHAWHRRSNRTCAAKLNMTESTFNQSTGGIAAVLSHSGLTESPSIVVEAAMRVLGGRGERELVEALVKQKVLAASHSALQTKLQESSIKTGLPVSQRDLGGPIHTSELSQTVSTSIRAVTKVKLRDANRDGR